MPVTGRAGPGEKPPASSRKRATASGRRRYQIHVPRRSLSTQPASRSDLQVVRHGGLADIAAGGEVAGAHGLFLAQLAEDREPRRVGGGLEEQDVRIGLALHLERNVLTNDYIVKYQYSGTVLPRDPAQAGDRRNSNAAQRDRSYLDDVRRAAAVGSCGKMTRMPRLALPSRDGCAASSAASPSAASSGRRAATPQPDD